MFAFRLILLVSLVAASLLAAAISAVFIAMACFGRVIPRKQDSSGVRAMESASIPPLIGAKRNYRR